MALDTSLNGLRNAILTSLFGRRLGFVPGNSSDQAPDYITGIKGVRLQVEGVSSAGSTVTSTSVANNLSPFGVSLVGASGASGTTAYQLAAPVPGITDKYIFNPTTGNATILTTAAGAFICSTGSAASTYGSITLVGKGAYVHLLALTTNLWGLAENLAITTVTTGNLVQIA
jgi:hypothetical protein